MFFVSELPVVNKSRQHPTFIAMGATDSKTCEMCGKDFTTASCDRCIWKHEGGYAFVCRTCDQPVHTIVNFSHVGPNCERCAHLTRTKIVTGEYQIIRLDGTNIFFPSHGDIPSKIKKMLDTATDGAHGSNKLFTHSPL